MTEITPYRVGQIIVSGSGERALLLGVAIFGLLLAVYIPYLSVYVPNKDDIPIFADGLLLAPGASWQDWFIRGSSHFLDEYPEWPQSPGTEYARPAFQFLIYLAYFAF